MVNLQLVHYIEKELNLNFNKKQITNILIKNNYSKKEIGNCFKYIDNKKTNNHINITHTKYVNTKEITPTNINEDITTNKESIPTTEQIITQEKHFKVPIEYTPKNMWIIIGTIILIIFGTFMIITAANYKQQQNIEINTSNSQENLTNNSNQITTKPIYSNNTQSEPKRRIGQILTQEEKEEIFNKMYGACIIHRLTFADESCLALATTDISKCNNDKKCMDDYYFFNSIVTDELKMCNKISNNEFKSTCITILNNNIENCNLLDDESEKISCESIILNQENKCNTISNEIGKNVCIDYFNFINGLKDSVENCKLIKNDIELKLACLSINNKDINECGNKELCKDNAQYSIALTTIDIKDCENIIDSNIKNKCINETSSKNI
jgi:hypothetical protein